MIDTAIIYLGIGALTGEIVAQSPKASGPAYAAVVLGWPIVLIMIVWRFR